MAKLFLMPKYVCAGENALNDSKDMLKKMGSKALIVTDRFMIDLGNVNKLENVLNEASIRYCIFDGITGEPTDIMIEEGTKAYLENNCDFMIAIGGGSPIDSMKAIAVLLSKDEELNKFMGKEIDVTPPNMVAIPTTAGTGSEATQFTIITDTKNDVKMLLKGKCLMPTFAIIDPVFTLIAPKSVTVGPGVDALCHCVEAYTSKKSSIFSDTFALSAIKRLFQYLPIVFDDGANIEARKEVSIAALEAGIAFNNSSVTVIHGMSRPIGALFHVPHGLSNAMLFYECMSYVLDGAYDRFATIARELGITKEKDDEKAAKEFLNALKSLLEKLEVPSLKKYGLDEIKFKECIDKMATDAMISGSPSNTIKHLEKEDLVKIYNNLWV